MDVVADQEDADAILLELLDELAHLRRLLRPERCGRLVHDQDARIEVDGPRDRHRLALAARKPDDGVLEALEARIEPAHHLAGFRFHGDVVERSPTRPEFASEEEIGSGVDIVGKRERLVDRLDAVFLGVARIGDVRFLAVHEDRPGIALVGAGQDLDERRLAGAVVAEQGDHFSLVEVDRRIVDRVDAAERDRHVLHLDERG